MSITRKEHKADIRKGVNRFRFIYIKFYVKFDHLYLLILIFVHFNTNCNFKDRDHIS